jgi:hypothetical protein
MFKVFPLPFIEENYRQGAPSSPPVQWNGVKERLRGVGIALNLPVWENAAGSRPSYPAA